MDDNNTEKPGNKAKRWTQIASRGGNGGGGITSVEAIPGINQNVVAFLQTPTSANLRTAVSDETGTGSAVFATSPTLTTPTLNSPTLTTPALGVATATSIAVGSPTGATAAGIVNAKGFKIDGVTVGASTDTYWTADGSDIEFAGGEVSAALRSDTTLGASGPVLGSSITARAVAPGLVFSGVAALSTTGVTAFGTGGWTQVIRLNQSQIRGGGENSYLTLGATFPSVYLRFTTNELSVYNGTDVLASGYIVPLGVNKHIVVTGDGTNVKFYIDGVLTATVAETVTNYTSANPVIGGGVGTYVYGTIAVDMLNRALTAAEVLSLYESGPSGADFSNAGSSLASSAFKNSPNSSFATFSGASATGFAAAGATGVVIQTDPISIVAGVSYRVAFDLVLNSGAVPDVGFINEALAVVGSTARPDAANGSNSIVLTAAITATTQKLFFSAANGATDFVVSNLTFVPLGLVLANSYSVGSGLTVPPLNGTSGTITLPASGVTWSQPNGNLISLGTVAANQATIAGDASGGLTVTPKSGTGFKLINVAEHADNAAAVTAGLAVGTFYRTGDVLKVVHA